MVLLGILHGVRFLRCVHRLRPLLLVSRVLLGLIGGVILYSVGGMAALLHQKLVLQVILQGNEEFILAGAHGFDNGLVPFVFDRKPLGHLESEVLQGLLLREVILRAVLLLELVDDGLDLAVLRGPHVLLWVVRRVLLV